MPTIHWMTLDLRGWTCPECGWGMDRAGGPNAPELAICRNRDCPTEPFTIIGGDDAESETAE